MHNNNSQTQKTQPQYTEKSREEKRPETTEKEHSGYHLGTLNGKTLCTWGLKQTNNV